MFIHNTRLQYTVRVDAPNPGLANLLLEQFGGPQGELAAAMRYFTQAVTEEDPGRKNMLLDIATEELSHLEVIGSLVAATVTSSRAGIDPELPLDAAYQQSGVGLNSTICLQAIPVTLPTCKLAAPPTWLWGRTENHNKISMRLCLTLRYPASRLAIAMSSVTARNFATSLGAWQCNGEMRTAPSRLNDFNIRPE
ncbi:manganese catalase family protein [Burkholderia vietnamiensis]|uniref:manganese catalase family protein n=1 Tax=Burkholderia vietnamiensis TaxID=60552 RepID=UPI0030C8C0E8